MACRGSCGCQRAIDTMVGAPDGIAGLDENGQVAQRGYIPTDHARYRGGDFSVVSNTWDELEPAHLLDLTVPAVTGDVIEVSVSSYWVSGAGFGCLDAATVDALDAAVNSISKEAPLDNADLGVSAWLGQSGAATPVGGSVCYTLQASDIVSGVVTLRLYARVTGAALALAADDAVPFAWSMKNLGQAA